MNEPRPGGDALDRLHEQGKQRAEAVPEFDVEQTLSAVRAAEADEYAPLADPPFPHFLASLTDSERQAFAAAGEIRTFAQGSSPMREGDRADYVMVILDGWVRISASEDGGQRVIAERGPGQLIGEVGIFRVNARSATVTVIETVQALVMRTRHFAEFLSDQQRVRAIVEDQIDERLTEEPYQWNVFPARAETKPLPSGENWTVVCTDIVGLAASQHDEQHRRAVRTANLLTVRASFGELWDNCIWTDQGDGLLICVSPTVPTSAVMALMHRQLPEQVGRHNRAHPEAGRLRLRVAVDVGPVSHDWTGMTGDTIIRAARMVDAPALRSAMGANYPDLGLAVSSFVYDNAIKQSDGPTSPGEYEQAEVQTKERRAVIWMKLIGPDPIGGPGAGRLVMPA